MPSLTEFLAACRAFAAILLAIAVAGLLLVGLIRLTKPDTGRLVPLRALAPRPGALERTDTQATSPESGLERFITPRVVVISNESPVLAGRVFRLPGEPLGSLLRIFRHNFIPTANF